MRLAPRSVRARLTLSNAAMLASVLALYLAGVIFLQYWQMTKVLERLAMENVETIKGLLANDSSGRLIVREDFHHHSDWRQAQEQLLEVLALDGTVLLRNDRLGGRSLGGPPFRGEGVNGYSARADRLSDGARVIAVSRTYEFRGQVVLIRIAYNQDLIWSRLGETLVILLLALPLALAATALAGYKMAERALAPVTAMAERAERIDSERLGERLPVGNPNDELGHLARVFNRMLGRIEQSFEQLKRFTADASHELRTPLAALRSTGEVGLHKGEGAEAYRDIIGSMLEEVDRLTSIVERLLTISRAESGEIALHPTVFPLLPLAREVTGLLAVLIEEKGLTFTATGDETASVCGDRLMLRQAVVNVVHNAVKFTPGGGTVTVRVEAKNGHSVLSVADTGPGISASDASKIFNRFYRAGEGRGAGANGAGLGLAIAKWAVEASGGEIGVERGVAGGSVFSIRLPAAPRTG